MKTSSDKKRPWQMILTVSGFQSRILALQFEHAWQHPEKTRLLKEERQGDLGSDNTVTGSKTQKNASTTTRLVQRNRSLKAYLINMALLCQSPLFGKHPLEVHILGEAASTGCMKENIETILPDYVTIINDYKNSAELQKATLENPGADPQIIVGGEEQLLATQVRTAKASEAAEFQDTLSKYMTSDFSSSISFSQLAPPPTQSTTEVCGLSDQPIDLTEQLMAVCSSCGARSLLTELAKHALEINKESSNSSSMEVLPVSVSCFSCDAISSWKEVARTAVLLRKYLVTKSLEDEDVED